MARARCPRSSVEAGQKCVKIKEQEMATFFFPSENRCLPASTLQPEQREFDVDSSASMHMISKKDLSDAEMDTLTKSCSPTLVITANGENHISLNTGFGYPATRRTSFLLWFQACQIRLQDLNHQLQGQFQDRGVIAQHLLQARLHHTVSDTKTREREDRIESDISPVTVSTTVDERLERPDIDQASKIPSPKKKPQKERRDTLLKERRDPLHSDIPEWLQEFRENLVDDEIPEHEDSHASSSHEVSLEPTFKRREDLGKPSVYTHFPKDRNCEICQRTKITRAPCRRRIGGAVLRAENFCDLITADHKVLSESCESRNNHR